jgi:HTH-type transcriptional regulator/antitoxin HipB
MLAKELGMEDAIARNPKQMGEALRRRRRALGLKQTQLSEKTRLRQATISGLEAGETGTQLPTLFDVLAALDLELVIRPRSKAPNKIEDLF